MPRIRVAAGACELELAGTEDFIKSHSAAIATMLERIDRAHVGATVPDTSRSEPQPVAPRPSVQSDMEFGEVLQLLPRDASGTDQVLLAGRFAQLEGDDDAFSTRDANRMLMEQGVKLANPSQSLRNNLTQKRVFKVGKRFRVSADGHRYLEGILTREVAEQ